MLLFIILAFFGYQPSKIQYQQKLAYTEGHTIERYSRYLNNSYAVFTESIANGNQKEPTDNHQPSPDNDSQKYMLWATIAAVFVNSVYVFVATLQLKAIRYQV